jgi:hypothetical protein
MTIVQNTNGLTTNPYRVIQAVEKIGNGADVVQNASASFGTVASVTGPNQIIMDTGYFPMNEFLGAHHFDVRWFSNIGSGNGINVQWWKMDKNGVESMSAIAYLAYFEGVADGFGTSGGGAYFSPNYQYRFVLISDSTVTANEYVAVDFMKITTEDQWKISCWQLNSSAQNVPTKPMMYGHMGSIPASSNPYVTVTVQVTGWNPSLAYIVPSTGNTTYLATITNTTSTSYDVTIANFSGGAIVAGNTFSVIALTMDPYMSV